MPQATTEVEQYGYYCSQAVDLGPVMPTTQFRVTDKVGTYLCVVWALVFEGSILAYNPARDKVEWVPAHGVTNDLSWVEEKSAMALANFVPCTSQEAARIAGLRVHRLMSWPDDSSSEEGEQEEDEKEEEEDECEEAEGQGEAGPKSLCSSVALEQGETEQEAKPHRQQSWEWGLIMDEEDEEGCLTFDDPGSDSDATAGGCSPVRSTPQELGSPRETTVEMHMWESEVEAL